jgi:hypothetical protein
MGWVALSFYVREEWNGDRRGRPGQAGHSLSHSTGRYLA